MNSNFEFRIWIPSDDVPFFLGLLRAVTYSTTMEWAKSQPTFCSLKKILWFTVHWDCQDRSRYDVSSTRNKSKQIITKRAKSTDIIAAPILTVVLKQQCSVTHLKCNLVTLRYQNHFHTSTEIQLGSQN